MEPKVKTKPKQKKAASSHGWKEMIQLFVGDLLAKIGDNVSEKIHDWLQGFKRKTWGIFFMALGFVFLLLGAVMFINVMLKNEFPWVGWGLVGAIVFLSGYFMSKETKN